MSEEQIKAVPANPQKAEEARRNIIEWKMSKWLKFDSFDEVRKGACLIMVDLDANILNIVDMGEEFPIISGKNNGPINFDKDMIDVAVQRVGREYVDAYMYYMDRKNMRETYESGKIFDGLDFPVMTGEKTKKWFSSSYMCTKDEESGHVLAYIYLFEYDEYRRALANLDRMAHYDSLTGVLNKGASHSTISIATQSQKGVLLLMDLDNFKSINDIYGHTTGDKFLTGFAQIIMNVTVLSDIIGRMGGDEFIAFIKGNVADDVIAEKYMKMNKLVLKLAKQLMGEEHGIPIGVSIGVVRVPEDGIDFDDLYHKADEALYEVKENGKHGYCIYDTIVKKEKDRRKPSSRIVMNALSERSVISGANELTEEQFKTVFRHAERVSRYVLLNTRFILFTAKSKSATDDELENTVKEFIARVCKVLRASDAVAPYGSCQMMVLLTEIERSDSDMIEARIKKCWDDMELGPEYMIESDSGWL